MLSENQGLKEAGEERELGETKQRAQKRKQRRGGNGVNAADGGS